MIRNGIQWILDGVLTREFLLSLVVEAIGIAVTVLIIDRLISSKERQRWAPSRDIYHARLLNAVDQFLHDALHAQAVLTHQYIFGDVNVLADRLEKLRAEDLIAGFASDIRVSKALKGLFDAGPYREMQREIGDAVSKGIAFLGPDATKLLLRLESELRFFVRVTIPNWDAGDDDPHPGIV